MVKGDGRERAWTYIDDVESLVDRGLGVERESSIDLGGDLAGDDLQDLGAELNEEVVESRFDLGIEVTTLPLGLSDGVVDQGRILGLLGGGEDEGGVGGGILGLVLANGCNSRQYGNSYGVGVHDMPVCRSIADRVLRASKWCAKRRGGIKLTGKVTWEKTVSITSLEQRSIKGDIPESLTTTYVQH